MYSISKILLFLLTVFSFGCSSIEFYEDKNCENEIGLEYYPAKPFLLIENNPAKDVSVKATIVYLPDKSKPKYIQISSGFGSLDTKFAFEHGILTSLGYTADSKIPETITAITGALTGAATAATGIAGLISGEPVEQAASETDMINADSIVTGIIIDVSKISYTNFTENQKKILNSLKKNLKDIEESLKEKNHIKIPNIVKKMKETSKLFIELACIEDVDSCKIHNGFLNRIIKDFNKALELINPDKELKAGFELYEIIFEKYNVYLRKVNINEI